MSNAFPENQDDFGIEDEVLDDELLSEEEELAESESLDASDAFFESDLVVAPAEPAPFGKSYAFDFTGSRSSEGAPGFAHGEAASRGPIKTFGLSTARMLIEKVLRTPRGVFPIYDDEYGVEGLERLISQPVTLVPLADFQHAIKDAVLSAHPRFTDVTDFTFVRDEDNEAIWVDFRVVVEADESLPFSRVRLPVGMAS